MLVLEGIYTAYVTLADDSGTLFFEDGLLVASDICLSYSSRVLHCAGAVPIL
jgi:hypothetical protein